MIKSKFLLCKESPLKAFYNLVLTGNKVLKVSGVTHPVGKIRDKRVFCFEDAQTAEKFFEKKIREKVHGNRRRVYKDMEFCFGMSGIFLGKRILPAD